MGAYTSKASGNWNATGQTTWNEVGTPGNGDTVTIALAHTVTADAGATITIGTSGVAGTAAITITGKLIIGTGTTFIVRGDVILNAATNAGAGTSGWYQLTMNAGAILEFDSSAAASPSTTSYVCGPARALAPDTRIQINGTSGSRCTVRSNAGGANGYFGLRSFNGRLGCMVATYCDFLRIGTSSIAAFSPNPTSTNGFVDTFSVQFCTLTSCGMINHSPVLPADVIFRLEDSSWTTSVASGEILNVVGTTAIGSGTRSVARCSFDKVVGNTGSSPSWSGFSFISNIFRGDLYCGYAATSMAAFTDNMIVRATSVFPAISSPSVLRAYYVDDNAVSNSKMTFASSFYSQTFDGLTWEPGTGSDTTGDGISVPQTPAPASLVTLTVKNCLVLPNPAGGDRQGTLVSQGTTSANWALVYEHNTGYAGVESMFVTSETAKSAAGTITSLKSNLCVNNGATGGSTGPFVIHDYQAGGATTDILAGANCKNNATTTGVLAGSAGRGVNLTMTSAPDSTNLTGVTPNFLDPTRNLAAWDASLGGAGTRSAALDRISANPSLIPAAATWVRAGWAPLNTALKGTAHDGGDIGAIDVFTPVPSRARPALGGSLFSTIM